MSTPRQVTILIVALALTGCAGAEGGPSTAAPAVWREAFPTFVRHTVAEFRSGYQAIAVDVDGDGLQDIVALSTGTSRLTWFRNPGWEPHEIETGAGRFINMAAHDIDGDGRTDLALASDFNLNNSTSGGLVHWARAPADPRTTSEWSMYPIDAVPTSHRIRWGDIDGDGRKELLNLPIVGIGASAPEYVGAVQLKAYRIPADPRGPWEALVLDDSRYEVSHGVEVVDCDGDAAADLLIASSVGVSLLRPGAANAADRLLHVGAGHDGPRPDRGSSEVALGRVGDGRFVAAVEPWHGSEVVVYTPGEPPALPWSRMVIETELTGGHGLVAADLNGDGYDEIIAGGRSGDRVLHIYRYRPDPAGWERIPLDVGGVAVSSLDVTDIDGDGDIDIVAMGSATGNVVLFENSGTM